MTVSELKKILDNYPDDMEVRVANYNHFIDEVDYETPSLELTNIDDYGWHDESSEYTVLAVCAE